MEKQTAYAQHKYARISPKKVAPVMDLVRGKGIEEAARILTFDPTKAAKLTLKVLNSAIANAVNNNKMKTDNLVVSEIWTGGGSMFKRFRFHGRHVDPILKRTAHIYIGLSERVDK